MAFKKKIIVEETPKDNSVSTAHSPTSKIEVDEAVTSFSITKKGGYWHVVTVESKGDKVLSTKLSKPAPKAAILIEFRITVGKFLLKISK